MRVVKLAPSVAAIVEELADILGAVALLLCALPVRITVHPLAFVGPSSSDGERANPGHLILAPIAFVDIAIVVDPPSMAVPLAPLKRALVLAAFAERENSLAVCQLPSLAPLAREFAPSCFAVVDGARSVYFRINEVCHLGTIFRFTGCQTRLRSRWHRR